MYYVIYCHIRLEYQALIFCTYSIILPPNGFPDSFTGLIFFHPKTYLHLMTIHGTYLIHRPHCFFFFPFVSHVHYSAKFPLYVLSLQFCSIGVLFHDKAFRPRSNEHCIEVTKMIFHLSCYSNYKVVLSLLLQIIKHIEMLGNMYKIFHRAGCKCKVCYRSSGMPKKNFPPLF